MTKITFDGGDTVIFDTAGGDVLLTIESLDGHVASAELSSNDARAVNYHLQQALIAADPNGSPW